MGITLQEVLDELEKNERVCPKPLHWQKLYNLLTEKKGRSGIKLSSPLILAAWWGTSDRQKMQRLQEQIKWASDHGCLDTVYDFLRDLTDEEWYYTSD